jgi:hypothetical protein
LWEYLNNGQTNGPSDHPKQTQNREHGRLLSSVIVPVQEDWMTDDVHSNRDRHSFDSPRRNRDAAQRERRFLEAKERSSSRLVLSAAKQAAESTKKNPIQEPQPKEIQPRRVVKPSRFIVDKVSSGPRKRDNNNNNSTNNNNHSNNLAK